MLYPKVLSRCLDMWSGLTTWGIWRREILTHSLDVSSSGEIVYLTCDLDLLLSHAVLSLVIVLSSCIKRISLSLQWKRREPKRNCDRLFLPTSLAPYQSARLAEVLLPTSLAPYQSARLASKSASDDFCIGALSTSGRSAATGSGTIAQCKAYWSQQLNV